MNTSLDAAFERMAAAGFELPNGFVNHGPMACEALDALAIGADLEGWATRFAAIKGGVDAEPVEPAGPGAFDADGSLGSYAELPEWIGFFDATIRTDGWPATIDRWIPTLVPGFSIKLFHGAIRAAHATRAIAAADTEPRRAELARALAYWAARYERGAQAQPTDDTDTEAAIRDAAVTAARRYVDSPNIFTLHGVTSVMAADLLVPHLSEPAARSVLAQVRADHGAFFGNTPPPAIAATADIGDLDWPAVARAAATSHDPHEVKLVEACRRGADATRDPAFAVASAIVTSRAA
jgi:hypothetical protein